MRGACDFSSVAVEELGHRFRQASDCWRHTPLRERIHLLARLRHLIVNETDAIARRLTTLTGKTPVEAVMTEIIPTVENIRYLEKNASRFLAPEKRPTPFSFRKSVSWVERHPWGWVLVLSPWNFPFQLSVVPLATALVAGNTAILKPSELSSEVGKMVVDFFHRAGFPRSAVTGVTGDGGVGEQLVKSGPDLIFLTGSAETGRRVMAAAAEKLTPLIFELGGKDPMIVFDDAPLERAVEGAVYGAFVNAGQVCVAVERLYVQEGIYDTFVNALAVRIQKLRVGTGMEDDLGALASPRQKEVVERHIDDALQKGARLRSERWTQGNLMGPVLLTEVTHAMSVMTEETFGPVLPVMRFRHEEEAVALANDSRFGLNASVWTRDLARGRRILSQLVTGNGAVNDVIKNIGNPHLPFGGVKQSGIGCSHGPEGLRAFTRTLATMVNTGTAPRELNWFPYGQKVYEGLKLYLHFSFLDRPWPLKIQGLWGFLRAFQKIQREGKKHGPSK